MSDFTKYLASQAHSEGFAAVSACNLGKGIRTDRLEAWIGRGFNAGMQYMQRNLEVRRDPRMLLEGAQSIIVFIAPYHSCIQDRSSGKYSGFALGSDYHYVLKSKIRNILDNGIPIKYRAFSDSAPIMEREWAQRCGLGAIGKNNFLISYSAGARVLIGCAVTDYIFQDHEISFLHENIRKRFSPDGACEGCSLCIKACPNKALGGYGRLDAAKCISYNTVENPGDIPAGLDTCGWVIGCEECLNACPFGHCDAVRPMPELCTNIGTLEGMGAAVWKAMDKADFKKTFKGTAFERPGLEKIKGNIFR